MSRRIRSHVIETKTKNNVRKLIDNDESFFRELTGRDYGIDGIIELYEKKNVTGKIAYVQIKGTEKKIKPLLLREHIISCPITTSSAEYAFQNNIPFILIYASTQDENMFYYVCLQEAEIDKVKLEKQKTITIHIPLNSFVCEDFEGLYALINKFY